MIEHGQDGRATNWDARFEIASKSLVIGHLHDGNGKHLTFYRRRRIIKGTLQKSASGIFNIGGSASGNAEGRAAQPFVMQRRIEAMSKSRSSSLAALLVAHLIGGTIAMGGEGTRLENLKQPPLNTTLMGVLKGASDYHGLNLSEPMIYGLSGHAFLINIHVELCPSGPYCWKRENAEPLIANMGLKMTDLGFFGTGAKKEARIEVERKLREALDKGIPCSLVNLDNQIITGYDETGFFCAQPWAPKTKFPPARLSFDTWKEFGKEYHVNFYTIEKVAPTDRYNAILASLDYAVDMHKNPTKHSSKAYGVGPAAYDNWIKAVPKEGSKHGNWWNATVWSECRKMAAKYFAEIGKGRERVSDPCTQLKNAYLKIAENLKAASNKKMDAKEKIKLLEETKKLEANAIEKVAELAAALRATKE